MNRVLWGFRRISRRVPMLILLLLSNLTTWHVCLILPVLVLRLIIRQVRLSPPFLLLLKISSSRTCPRTVRLVIFITDLHGVVTLCQHVETVAPPPTADVIAVIVVTTSVTTQSPHTASKARHIKIKGRRELKCREKNKHGCTRKIHTRTPCVKNHCRNNERTTGPKTHKTNTTNRCSQLLTHSICVKKSTT